MTRWSDGWPLVHSIRNVNVLEKLDMEGSRSALEIASNTCSGLSLGTRNCLLFEFMLVDGFFTFDCKQEVNKDSQCVAMNHDLGSGSPKPTNQDMNTNNHHHHHHRIRRLCNNYMKWVTYKPPIEQKAYSPFFCTLMCVISFCCSYFSGTLLLFDLFHR